MTDTMTTALLNNTLGIGRHGLAAEVEPDHDAHVRHLDNIVIYMMVSAGVLRARQPVSEMVYSPGWRTGLDPMLKAWASGNFDSVSLHIGVQVLRGEDGQYYRHTVTQWVERHNAHVAAWEARTVPAGWVRLANGAIGPRPSTHAAHLHRLLQERRRNGVTP